MDGKIISSIVVIVVVIIFGIYLSIAFFHKSVFRSLPPSVVITRTPTQQISPSPTTGTSAQPGEHCGGFIRNARKCPSGYHCQLGKIPDAGGICVAN